MSSDRSVYSTEFHLAAGVEPKDVRNLVVRHMEDYAEWVEIEPGRQGGYELRMDTANVGGSFDGRVKDLVAAIGPLVVEPFAVTVCKDSGSSDEHAYYGGPDPEQVAVFEGRCQIYDALELLGKSEPARQARQALEAVLAGSAPPAMGERELNERIRLDALQALLERDFGEGKAYEKVTDALANYRMATEALQKLGVQTEPTIVVTVSGGNVQGVQADAPGVRVIVMDHDTEDAKPGEGYVRLLPDGASRPDLVRVGEQVLDIVPEAVEQAQALLVRPLYAFARDGDDWSALVGQQTPDMGWFRQDGVIVDVTDPVRPKLAVDLMFFWAEEIGKPMQERLDAQLQRMGLAAARGEDAQPGFDEEMRRLASLLDWTPYERDVDSGELVPRGTAAARHRREGR